MTVGAYHLAKNSRILGKKSNGTATFEKFRLEIRVTSKGTPFFPFVTGSFKIVYHLLSSLVSSLLCRSCSLFNMRASMYQYSFCNAASTGLFVSPSNMAAVFCVSLSTLPEYPNPLVICLSLSHAKFRGKP